MIDVIGAPFDLCGKRTGARLGPPAIRLAGLEETLCGLGQEVSDLGDLPIPTEEMGSERLRFGAAAIQNLTQIERVVSKSISEGHLPLVLGGDHSIAIGGIRAALNTYGADLALLWLDAHSDLNTPATSPSGNLHGMPVGALLGIESGAEGIADEQWAQIIPTTPLKPENVAFFGLRELDPGEQQVIGSLQHCYKATMHEIDRHGIVSSMRRLGHWLDTIGAKRLWISFDVDMLDPVLAPGTGTAVRGGLTYREAHLVAELIRELFDKPDCPYQLAGLDVVEINPLFDSHNETAKTAVEWIGSLFGKTILGNKGHLVL
ncbi:MAG: arginase [Fimbriimonadaceae bacterium]